MRPNCDNSDYITLKLLYFTSLATSEKQREEGLYPDTANKNPFVVYYVCPCLGQEVRGTVEMLLVICFAKLSLFFSLPFHFRAVGLFVKVWLLMKADRQPGAGCECWSKAGRTNVCTHTSILSPAARGDVKHNDVVRGCGRALRGATRKSWHRQGHSFIHKNTRRITSKSCTLTCYYMTCENNNGAVPSIGSTFGLEWSPLFSKHSNCPHYSSHSIV